MTYIYDDIYTRANTTPQLSFKGENIRILEDRMGLSYIEGRLYIKVHNRGGVLCKEIMEREMKRGKRLRKPFDLREILIPATLPVTMEKDPEYQEQVY
jgi:hypothetical protein